MVKRDAQVEYYFSVIPSDVHNLLFSVELCG